MIRTLILSSAAGSQPSTVAGLALLIATLCLAGVVAVLLYLNAVRAANEQTLTAEVRARIGTHGLWVGAWLVGIAASKVDVIGAQAPGGQSPEEVLRLWEEAGARVISHVAGPEVISESEARGWIEQASEDLARARVQEQAGFTRERVFALFYGSKSPPPVTTRSPSELSVFLTRPGIFGAVFVVCPSAGGSGRLAWISAAITCAVLFVAGIVAALIGSFAPSPDPSTAAPPAATSHDAAPASAVPSTMVPQKNR